MEIRKVVGRGDVLRCVQYLHFCMFIFPLLMVSSLLVYI